MKLYEYQAKQIFNKENIAIPKGLVVDSFKKAAEVAYDLNTKVAIKSQVLIGGRGKAGGIKFASSPKECENITNQLIGSKLKGAIVKEVLVEERLSIQREFYLSIVLDRKMKKTVIIFSAFGGMDIEEISKKHPEKIIKVYIEELLEIQEFYINRFMPLVDNNRDIFLKLKEIIKKLYFIYKKYDCLIVEINPLVLTDKGDLIALDGKMEIDDNARYRQNYSIDIWDKDEENPIELIGKKAGFVVIKLKGNISIISNGAGLALFTLDLLHKYNMGVANILDLSGGATSEKVIRAAKVVIQDKDVKGILFNIFGGITRCDEIARGIAGALKDIPKDLPVICRLQGTNREEGISILKDVDLNAETDLEEAVKSIVLRINRG